MVTVSDSAKLNPPTNTGTGCLHGDDGEDTSEHLVLETQSETSLFPDWSWFPVQSCDYLKSFRCSGGRQLLIGRNSFTLSVPQSAPGQLSLSGLISNLVQILLMTGCLKSNERVLVQTGGSSNFKNSLPQVLLFQKDGGGGGLTVFHDVVVLI